MDLTTYMIITSIYWTIAFYYPFKTTSMKKRLIIRLFWLLYLLFIALIWMRNLVTEDREPQE